MIVKNYQRFRQPLLFDGLQTGAIYPTDIDAVLEYKDKLWLIVEVKAQGGTNHKWTKASDGKIL